MQRIGRSGHAQYRLIVQDSRFSPKSGRVVAYVGSYNPHTKVAVVDKQKVEDYLKNGARPSDTFSRLLKKEGVKLPKWVQLDKPQKKSVKNPDKLKRNRPKDSESPKPAEEPSPQAEGELEQPTEANQPEAAEPTITPKEEEAPKALENKPSKEATQNSPREAEEPPKKADEKPAEAQQT